MMTKLLAGAAGLLAVLSLVLFMKVGSLAERLEALEARPTPAPPPAQDAPPDGAPVLERLAWLEGEVARLKYQRPAGGPPSAGLPKGHLPGNTGAPPPRAVLTGSGDAADVVAQALDSDDPVVRDKLAEVFREEQQRLEQERDDRRMDHRLERLKAQITEFSERVGLSAQDTVWLTDRLSAESYEIRDMWRAARENGTWHETRDKMTEVRERTETEVKDVLDEDAYAEFEKMREEEVARFRGFGRGARRATSTDTKKDDGQ